jgi:hypothetical protein
MHYLKYFTLDINVRKISLQRFARLERDIVDQITNVLDFPSTQSAVVQLTASLEHIAISGDVYQH